MEVYMSTNQLNGNREYLLISDFDQTLSFRDSGIVAEDHIYGTRFRYAQETGEIQSIVRVPAGYGKVAVLEQLRGDLSVGPDHLIYVGDGSSDVNVMLHVNRLGGLTVAVSDNKH